MVSSSPLCVRVCWTFQGVGGLETKSFRAAPDAILLTANHEPALCVPPSVCLSKGCVPHLSVGTKCYCVITFLQTLHWPPSTSTASSHCAFKNAAFVQKQFVFRMLTWENKITALLQFSGTRKPVRIPVCGAYRASVWALFTFRHRFHIVTFCACEHSWQHRAESRSCPQVSESAFKKMERFTWTAVLSAPKHPRIQPPTQPHTHSFLDFST